MEEEKRSYELVQEQLRRQGLAEKYEHPGIYCIKVLDKVVYVGKSTNMLVRIASHIDLMNRNDNAHKYQVLNECFHLYGIEFDVLDYCQSEDELGNKERERIRQYLSPILLNTQIPKEEDYHKYLTNRFASKVTAQMIASYAAVGQK